MEGQTNVGAWIGIAVTLLAAGATLWWALRLFRSYRPSRRGGRLDRLRNPGYIVLIIGFFVMGGVVWQLIEVLAPGPGSGGAAQGDDGPAVEPTSPFYPILSLAGEANSADGLIFASNQQLWHLQDWTGTAADDKPFPVPVSAAPIDLYSLVGLPDGTLLGSGLTFTETDPEEEAGGEEEPQGSSFLPLGLVRSSDGGETWQEVALEGEALFSDLTAADDRGEVLFARQIVAEQDAMPPGLYRSRDGGRRWEPVSTDGLPVESLIFGLAALDAQTVVAGTDQGLFIGTEKDGDGGQWSWQTVLADQTVTAVHRSWTDADQVLFYTTAAEGGLQAWHRSEDRFVSLDLQPIGNDAIMVIDTHPRTPDTIFAASFLGSLYGYQDGRWHTLAGEDGGAD